MRCNFTHITLLTGTMLILSSVSFAAPSSAKSQDESARLLKGVAADARQIQMEASDFQKLTKDSGATWKQYDRQWNEMEPVVETMRGKIARLESLESSLPTGEKQAVDQSKAEYQKIAWHSRELGKLVDAVPPDLKTPQFNIASRDLVKEASDLARDAKAGI